MGDLLDKIMYKHTKVEDKNLALEVLLKWKEKKHAMISDLCYALDKLRRLDIIRDYNLDVHDDNVDDNDNIYHDDNVDDDNIYHHDDHYCNFDDNNIDDDNNIYHHDEQKKENQNFQQK